jgi:SOS-response transcriptional repressor LexA
MYLINIVERFSNDKVAVCFIDGEFTVKRLHLEEDHILLGRATKMWTIS